MAMVLDAFTSYVQSMLTELTEDEVPMLLGVSGEIEQMGFKLWDLKNFLADDERRFITEMSVQNWVTQLKQAMYEATVILDICQLKAMERGPYTEGMGCFNPLLFSLRNPLHANNIGRRIKALNQRLETIKERSSAFNFINLGSYEDRNSKVRGANTSRETSAVLDRSGVVSEKIEHETRKLVEILLTEREGSSNIMVVAIVGVAGIGKTTLAQKVFNDEAIKAEFHNMIWLSVNQDFSEAELLRVAIKVVGGDHRTAGNEKAALQRTLVDALNRHKILLVMDDVWNHRAWTDVLRTPFVDAAAQGSRVLVTTRHDTVAIQMKAMHCHHVDKLGPDDAWLLLKKQVIPSEINEPEVDMLKDVGLRIIQKCDGLPLAIKVMGGLLRQKELHHRDWEMVLHDSIWPVSEMPEELSYAVYLSYEDLPPGLRQCFLHYSILPNNTEFSEHDIIGMWISEGFLHGNADELEELGSNYYKELILRNLIEHDTRYVGQSVCKMQNIVRSFAQYVARDEALVGHNGKTGITSKLNLREFIRLSIETKELESDEFKWSFIQSQISLRTLILVGHFVIQSGDSLAIFPSLRTLHIESANFAALVKYLYELKHLRYLSIAHTDVSILPENISQLKFLQHISLVGCEGLVKLPDSIVKLGQLRYLGLNDTNINGIPRGFHALRNLRTLYGFPAHMDGDWCSLEELGPLSQLKALGLKGLDNVSSTSSASKARLGEKVHLTELFLHCSSRLGYDGLVKEEEGVSEEEQCRIEELFDELCPPPCLQTLGITNFCRRLPRWMMSTSEVSLKSLRILRMDDLACCTQLPDGLCQLPCLEFVQIDRAPAIKRVGPEFLQPYHHHSYRPSQVAAAFPRLNKMKLAGMVEWEEWEWEEEVQAMPVLEVLLLEFCKLRRLPPGLASHARTLKEFYVENVQYLNSLENFASLVELEVVHNPDLQRIINLPRLQKLSIFNCRKVKVLENLPSLQRLVLGDSGMETLPEYMRHVKPRHLQIDCSLALLTSIAAGRSSPEWDKFGHIEHVKAYAYDGDIPKKWYVMYTEYPCNLETNISVSSMLAESTTPVVKDEDELIVKDGDERIGKDEAELLDTEFSNESAAALCKDDSELVGIDSPCEDLIKLLVHGEDTCEKQIKLVSICGIGGLGKTTIACAVYKRIANKFDCRAFVSVSHNLDETKITLSISDKVGYPCPNFEVCDIQHLINRLRIFQGKRYLIVVDNICDISVWNLVKPALINNNCGSSIITTTRKVDVAKSVGGVYELPLLSYNDSKMLFYRRTFRSEDDCPSQYRDICEKIVSKCGQLPSDIINITSSLLDKAVDYLEEWKNVCNSIGSGLKLEKRVENILRMILSRSYEDIPAYLKKYLLYLSIFPVDYEITRDNLVQRWIAEDLIHEEHGQSLQELGESYFDELVKTGLIREGFGKDISCCVPVLMLDLIVYLSTKENSVTISSGQQPTDLAHKVQRLSLQASDQQYDLPAETKTFGQTSSLFCGADFMPSLQNFQGLRVLDLENCHSLKDDDLKDLGNLVELRYLVLGSSDITKIPKKVKKLHHLQTLDLTATCVKEVPSSIVKLTQLRRLLINRYTKVPAGIIGKLQALEELADIGISNSPNILEDISTMTELRVLSIALWSWDEHQSRLLPEALRKLSTQKLKHLSIFTSCLIDFPSNLQPVLQELEKLDIQGSTFDKLPNWIGQLAKLGSLSIEVYSLEKGTFEILGGLSHLRFLSLTAKRIPGEKEKLVVGSDGFRSLRTFHLSNRAMAITFEKEAMQGLQRLELTLQASLTKEFFFGLENLYSLKHVQVEIICFSATDGMVKAAEAAIGSMIGNNPNKPTLGIKRTMEDYKISDTMREAGREAKAQEESVSARKKSRKARKKNKRKH